MTNSQKLRLLFLDFDGVVHPYGTEATPSHFCWLPELERLLAPFPDVQIVVHSTWRYDHHDRELRALLGSLGERFVGSAPRGPRQQAIESVLHANRGRVSSHLVLDDAPSEFANGKLNVVVLDGQVGISDLRAQAAVAAWLASTNTSLGA